MISEDAAQIYESVLKKILKKFKPKNIGFVGVIFDRSKTQDVYLGTLVFPRIGKKIGDSLIELMEINRKVEFTLKKKVIIIY